MLPALLFILLFYTGFHVWWPAMFVMLVPLALLATTPGKKNAWLTAGACITAWYAVHAFVSTWSGLLCVLLAVVHGGLHALGMLFLRHTAHRTRRPLALLLPATWITIEWLRLLPPWGVASGVMAHPLHAQRFLIQSADLGGIHFISLLVVLTNGLLADLYLRWRAGASREERMLRVTFILSLWAVNAVYGAWRIVQTFDHSPESIAIGVIQPDVPGLEHEIAGIFDRKQYIADLLRLSDEALKRAAQKPALIVWPESLATVPVVDDDPAARRPEAQSYIEAASGWATREGIPILAGFSRWDRTGTLRNTSWLFTPGTLEPAPIQDKQHLFPFGESMPIPWEPLREKIASWTGRSSPWMEPGAERRIFTVPGTGVNAVIAICNEAGFSRSSGIFLPGRDKPFHLLIVQANEGGFHRNAALPLHASLLPFRAIEGRLTIARAANTGISGFVDSTGRVYGTVANKAGEAWTGRGAPELSLIPELLTGGTASGSEDVRAQFSSLQSLAGVTGARTGLVQPDPRRTLFSRTGEWTGPLCAMVSLALLFAPGRKSANG